MLYKRGTVAAALAVGALWPPGAMAALALLLGVPLVAAFFSFLAEPSWRNPASWALAAVGMVFLLREVFFR